MPMRCSVRHKQEEGFFGFDLFVDPLCSSFGDGVELAVGSEVRLQPGDQPSTAELIHVSYEGLVATVQPGDMLTLGDGNVVIEVTAAETDALRGQVLHGGVAKGRPGVHIPADRLDVSAPTPDDLAALDPLVEAGIDMVALSFVRTARDIRGLVVAVAGVRLAVASGPGCAATVLATRAAGAWDGVTASAGVMIQAAAAIPNPPSVHPSVRT